MVAVILRTFFCLTLLAALAVSVPAQAATAAQEVQTSWRLLDYIAVDYREAVAGGRVINPLEYDEMIEFSSSVSAKLAALPVKPERAKLIEDARAVPFDAPDRDTSGTSRGTSSRRAPGVIRRCRPA